MSLTAKEFFTLSQVCNSKELYQPCVNHGNSPTGSTYQQVISIDDDVDRTRAVAKK